jgi:protein-tyrosine phosphatase
MASNAVVAAAQKPRPGPIKIVSASGTTQTGSVADDTDEMPAKISAFSPHEWDLRLQANHKLAKLFKEVIHAIIFAKKSATTSTQPVEFVPGLWLGAVQDTGNFDNLATVMDDPSLVELFCAETVRARKNFEARDDTDTDIMALFPEIRRFLDEVVSPDGPRTLIHCQAGINRSATLATAYYMYKTGKPLLDAIDHMVRLRPIILRNEDFIAQLTIWAVDNGFAKLE